MTAVFRSCLPGFYSNANQSISSDNLSYKTNSHLSLNNDENSIDCYSSIITNENLTKSKIQQTTNSLSKTQLINNECNLSDLSMKISQHSKTGNTKERTSCCSRKNKQQKPLLKRLVGTIFGESAFNNNKQNKILSTEKQRIKRLRNKNSKKSFLPSKSILKKQYNNNEKTLHSLVTLLAEIESNIQLSKNSKSITNMTIEKNSNQNFSIENEQARNNNRLDDTYSIHSNDSSHYHKLKDKHNYQNETTSKHYKNTRSIRKYHSNNNSQIEDDNLSCSSMTSHYILRRKMIDNQQQTQIYPTRSTINTSTQINNVNDLPASESSWYDVMKEDQTTINAWARIRHRLRPNQQKDILRALMIICANLFEVPIENKQI